MCAYMHIYAHLQGYILQPGERKSFIISQSLFYYRHILGKKGTDRNYYTELLLYVFEDKMTKY